MYTEEKGEGGTKKGRNERRGGRGVTWAEPRLCPWPWEVLLPWRRLSTEGGRSADLTVTAALTRAFLEPKLPSTEDKQAAETMGPPSVAPHGGHRPWQGLLITGEGRTLWEWVGGGSTETDWSLLGRRGQRASSWGLLGL